MASSASFLAATLALRRTLPQSSTAVSQRCWSSGVSAASSNISADCNNARTFSSRPAAPRGPPAPRAPLRTHAVSLYRGDYTDAEVLDSSNNLFTDTSTGAPRVLDLHRPPTARAGARDFTRDDEEDETRWLYDGTPESRQALAAHRAWQAEKSRRVENARPPLRVSEIDSRGRSYGRGSRKSAQARVWIQPGEGEVVVNRREFSSYFCLESDREKILGPFVATSTCGSFDVVAQVRGGGTSGQAGAIRLGLARALEKYDPDYRPAMKYQGFLTRDPRKVERKKIGLKKARKAPQWVRR